MPSVCQSSGTIGSSSSLNGSKPNHSISHHQLQRSVTSHIQNGEQISNMAGSRVEIGSRSGYFSIVVSAVVMTLRTD